MLVLGRLGPPYAGPGGGDGVVADVRRTRDDVLVVSPDPAYDGRPLVGLAAAAVALPTVADLLAAAGPARLVLDVRNEPGEPDFDAPAERTVRLLLDLLDRLAPAAGRDLAVASADWFAIEAVRAARPGLATGFVTPPGVAAGANLAYVVDQGHAECHPDAAAVLAERGVVDAARAAGVRVVCRSVAGPDQARRLADLGVHAVVCAEPGVIRTALGR